MAISYMSAAATICETSGWTKSNLEVQKLLYLGHMKFLGIHAGKPLVSKMFEAWKYGPVLPDLYHRLKIFGDKPINDFFLVSRNLDLNEHKTLIEVVNQFADYSPGDLVEITHVSGGAWDQYFASEGRGVPIPNDAILDEYNKDPF